MAAACSGGNDEADEGLTLFAAASLRTVTDELESAWLEAHPQWPLTIATEASNVLAAQITEGAEADLFLSADDVRPQELAEAGYTSAQPVPFARNSVVLVVRPDGSVRMATDIAQPGTRIVTAGPGVPIGRYTQEAIAALATTTDDPAGFAAAVEANIASREDNVRAALAKVELGEGDAAFVYLSDALGSEDTLRIELPVKARIVADYSAVLTSERPAGADFLAWLGGPTATEILTEAGFEVAS